MGTLCSYAMPIRNVCYVIHRYTNHKNNNVTQLENYKTEHQQTALKHWLEYISLSRAFVISRLLGALRASMPQVHIWCESGKFKMSHFSNEVIR